MSDNPISPASTTGYESQKRLSDLKKPKLKRVRRDKVELDHLRLETRKLQVELAQMQAIHTQQRGISSQQRVKGANYRAPENSQAMYGYRLIAPRKRVKEFMWQHIAESQLKERMRAQTRNQELREQLKAECELGRQMMILLHRRPMSQHSAALQDLHGRHSIPIKSPNDIFEDQVVQAENALLDMDRVLQRPAFKDMNACFVNTSITTNKNAKAFVMESNMILPFASQVAANAVWKVLTTDKMKKHCYEHRVVHKSDTVVSQDFGIHFITDVSDADFRCKYTICRFNDAGRVVVVWVAMYEPIELNELQYSGIRCQQLGWVEFKDSRSAGASSTRTRSYSRLTFDVNDDTQKKELQVRSLFNLAQPIHEKVASLCSSMLEKALIEEDWKMQNWSTE
ncbi:hypothetical protein PRIC2_012395 [Phytophthora ramorum]